MPSFDENTIPEVRERFDEIERSLQRLEALCDQVEKLANLAQSLQERLAVRQGLVQDAEAWLTDLAEASEDMSREFTEAEAKVEDSIAASIAHLEEQVESSLGVAADATSLAVAEAHERSRAYVGAVTTQLVETLPEALAEAKSKLLDVVEDVDNVAKDAEAVLDSAAGDVARGADTLVQLCNSARPALELIKSLA